MLGRFISGFLSIKASDNTLIRGGILTAFCGILMLTLPLGSFSVFTWAEPMPLAFWFNSYTVTPLLPQPLKSHPLFCCSL